MSITQLREGDTLDPVLVAGRNPISNTAVSATEPGWQCEVSIVDGDNQSEISAARAITETISVDGIDYFLAKMLRSEAALMVNNFNYGKPKKYEWLITVFNAQEDYERTTPRYIAVSKR